MRKQSFIEGAVILMIANAISKILGAVFKIPLTYILREEGMAVFNTAFQVYIMMLSFVISGFPFAITKSVSELLARDDKKRASHVIRVSSVLLCLLGIAGSIALFFGAKFFAYAMKEPRAVLAIQAIAPSIFFVAWGVAYKSYYQGSQNMIPTAISQVVEAFVKLGAGYALAVFFVSSMERAAAGAISGVTVGELVATLVLFLLYIPRKQKGRCETGEGKAISKELLAIAVPLLLASLISNMMSLIDISVIRLRLSQLIFTPETAEKFLSLYGGFTSVFQDLPRTLRITEEGAGWLYGAYSGYAMTVFNLPVGIMATFGVSIVPVVAGSVSLGNWERANRTARLGFKIIMLITIPCAVFMYWLSGDILAILFHNQASAGLLACIAPCVAILCLAQLASSVLQASGRIFLPFIYSFIGSAIKLILNYVLVGDPRFHIYGAPISSLVSCLVIMVLSLHGVRKHMGLKLNFMEIIIKPALCGAVMMGALWLLKDPVRAIVPGRIPSLLLLIACSGVAYVLMLFLTNAVTLRELRMLKK